VITLKKLLNKMEVGNFDDVDQALLLANTLVELRFYPRNERENQVRDVIVEML